MCELSAAALRRRFQWASATVLLLHLAIPVALGDQLRLEALLQEGDLLLEEAATLSPSDEQLAEEGRRLVASEQTLREEVQALNQNITEFNAAMAEQNKAVQTFQTRCPAHTSDHALADACDKRIAQLRDQANLLEDDRLQLHARQEELSARVDKQNAWGRDYGKRKGAQDAHDRLNQRDSEEWLGRAKQFLASEDFAPLLAHAGNPPACSADQMAEITALGTRSSLERIQVCLKALKAGNP
jgi:DNA repair exonuclease SbcCD ATPase subunit